MNIKELIEQKIVHPTSKTRGEIAYKIARVLKANEKLNECSIRYIDNNGIERNEDNVKVKVYEPLFTDWFPRKGDIVELEEIRGATLITGLLSECFEEHIKPLNFLTSDIHASDMSANTFGGFIF